MKALAIPDTHFPWVNRKYVKNILEAIEAFKPQHILQMGDLYDFYSFSRYAKTLNLITPREEIRRGRKDAAKFWEAVHKAAPKAKRYQLLGNHDDRLVKLVGSKAPELEAVFEVLDFLQLWRFPGVELQEDSREELVIPGLDKGKPVMFMHGHRGHLGAHARYNAMSTCVGHSHHGGVVYERFRGRTIWELNSGYIADQSSKPLNYAAQKISNSVPGVGLIDEWGPRFIPF